MVSSIDDPRVRKTADCRYEVTTDDEYVVSDWSLPPRPPQWWARPAGSSRALTEAASTRSAEELGAWLLEVRRGPFATAEEAISWLLENR